MRKCRILIILATIIVADIDVLLAQGYGGPSMLSRGGNRPGRRGRAPTDIAVYGAIRGTLETGLTPVQLENDGTIVSQDVYGVQAEIGAYGTHSWSRTILGLDYRGDYRRTTRFNNYNGLNQAVSLDLQFQPTRRWMLFFRETGGTTNRAFGGFAAPAIADPGLLNLANNEVFDSRLYFSQTNGTVAYRKSARTTYIVSGDYFFTKRPDQRLVSTTGWRTSGGLGYRLSARTSVGGTYNYLRFDFPRAFAGTEAHGALLSLTREFSQNLTGTFEAGALRLETFGNQRVDLSPEVAAILGRTQGIEAFVRRVWVPQINASLAYSLERARLMLSYITGVSPGNGVYLTSRSDSVSLGYSFTGIRKWSLGASAAYRRLTSESLEIGNLTQLGVGGGVNYSMTRMLNISSQLDYRTFRSPGLRGREGFALTLGITVSPGRFPVSIW